MTESLLSRARRVFDFGRHIPAAKIARRLQLGVKRRLRDRFPASNASRPTPHLREAIPHPLFAPRTGLTADADGSFALHAVGRSIPVDPNGVSWARMGLAASDQLPAMTLHYMEYLEAADDALFSALVLDWIGANPEARPGTWRDAWNAYALSLRVVVWMQQLAERRAQLAPDLVETIAASLTQQIRHLMANLETDLGGNHLLKNAKALIWSSAVFVGAEARRWGEIGRDLLDQELGGQILPDGVHDERSPSYHCQVHADLLECRQVLGAGALGGRLDDALGRMAQATADLAHPDGAVVQFNDAGLSMAYAPSACLSVHATLFGVAPSPRVVFAYPDAGYFGARVGQVYIAADCGRIAPDALPAHGHGDVLSFELSVAGRRMIVDQGVFEYVAGPRRAMARSAASHNTPAIPGRDQAEFFGAFRCGRRPSPRVLEHVAWDDGFKLIGTHNGYVEAPGQPRPVRQFELTPNRLEIIDRVAGAYLGPVRIGFLLHPDVEIVRDSDALVLRSGTGEARFQADAPVSIEPAVWWPDIGVERATRRLVIGSTGDRTVTSVFDFETARPAR
jgi:uncharacterized heparinase superfamily protein